MEKPVCVDRRNGATIMPFLPIGPFLQTKYDVKKKIEKTKVPLLVLHGERDEVVPIEQGKKVFDAAPEPKKFFTITGAAHNDAKISWTRC